jgi:hypothetical protein
VARDPRDFDGEAAVAGTNFQEHGVGGEEAMQQRHAVSHRGAAFCVGDLPGQLRVRGNATE